MNTEFIWTHSSSKYYLHKLQAYCIHIKKTSRIGLKTLLQSRCYNLVL